MDAKRCDRCGEFYCIDEPKERAWIELNDAYIELCETCTEEFYKWLVTSFLMKNLVKNGGKVPIYARNCYNCTHYKRVVPRQCMLGKPYRDVEEICEEWRFREDG